MYQSQSIILIKSLFKHWFQNKRRVLCCQQSCCQTFSIIPLKQVGPCRSQPSLPNAYTHTVTGRIYNNDFCIYHSCLLFYFVSEIVKLGWCGNVMCLHMKYILFDRWVLCKLFKLRRTFNSLFRVQINCIIILLFKV